MWFGLVGFRFSGCGLVQATNLHRMVSVHIPCILRYCGLMPEVLCSPVLRPIFHLLFALTIIHGSGRLGEGLGAFIT